MGEPAVPPMQASRWRATVIRHLRRSRRPGRSPARGRLGRDADRFLLTDVSYRLATSAGLGRRGRREPAGGVPAHQPLVGLARGDERRLTADAAGDDPARRRVAGRRHRANARRRPGAAPRSRDAADVGSERRRPGSISHVRGDEDDRARGAHARRDRRAGRAEEREVDRLVGELRVHPSDDEAARAGELVLHLRPRHRSAGRDDDPRPGDLHARVEAAALVRRTGRAGDGERREGREQAGGHERASHATLRNQNAERQAPTRSSAAPPPAKRSVISRDCRLCPSREPRFSYTSRSSLSVATRKN